MSTPSTLTYTVRARTLGDGVSVAEAEGRTATVSFDTAADMGGGLFGHGTLTATMNNAPEDQRGLALGAWGAVQATAAGAGVALGGIIRDTLSSLQGGVLTPYLAVYVLEVILLIAAIVTMNSLIRSQHTAAASPTAHIQ